MTNPPQAQPNLLHSSSSHPKDNPLMKPALYASPQPVESTTGTSKAGVLNRFKVPFSSQPTVQPFSPSLTTTCRAPWSRHQRNMSPIDASPQIMTASS